MAIFKGPKFWVPTLGSPSALQAFATNLNPPSQKLEMNAAPGAVAALRRTIADVIYTIVITATGANDPPPGWWTEPRVSLCLWADPTGGVLAGGVPYAFTRTLPPFPLWEGLLYPTYEPFSGPSGRGFAISYRPLEHIDTEAQRDPGPDLVDNVRVWASIKIDIPSGFLIDGVTAAWKLQMGVKSLFQSAS
jgi:hypothetical protein